MKRIVSLLLVLVMAISVFAISSVSTSAKTKHTGFDYVVEGSTGWATVPTYVYKNTKSNDSSNWGKLDSGDGFIIQEETGAFWKIAYKGHYGYVRHEYCMINLRDIFKDAHTDKNHAGVYFAVNTIHDRYRDKNNKIHQMSVPSNCCYKWNTDKYIPMSYHTAKMVGQAKYVMPGDKRQSNGSWHGLRLKIYDTFRPYYISVNLNNLFEKYINNGTIDLKGQSSGNLLASCVSFHNTGSALDVTLCDMYGREFFGAGSLDTYTTGPNSKAGTYTPMFELSAYSAADYGRENGCYGELGTSAGRVKKFPFNGEFGKYTVTEMLHRFFMNEFSGNTTTRKGAVMDGLTSEWWHYQDSVSRDTVLKSIGAYYYYKTNGTKNRGGFYKDSGYFTSSLKTNASKYLAKTVKDPLTTTSVPMKAASVNGAGTGIDVTWQGDAGMSYRVYVNINSKGWQEVKDVKGTSFAYGEAVPGKTYAFVVRALDADGNLVSGHVGIAGTTAKVKVADQPKLYCTALKTGKGNNIFIDTNFTKSDKYGENRHIVAPTKVRLYVKRNGTGSWTAFYTGVPGKNVTDSKGTAKDLYSVRGLDGNHFSTGHLLRWHL